MIDQEKEQEFSDLVEKIADRAFELQDRGEKVAANELMKVADEILKILGYI